MRAEDKWADKLRHKMDNYAEPLPDDMWKRIEHESSVPRMVPLWRRMWSYAAVVALLLVSSWAVWFWTSTISPSHLAEQSDLIEEVMKQESGQLVPAQNSLPPIDVDKKKQMAAVPVCQRKPVEVNHNLPDIGNADNGMTPDIVDMDQAMAISVDDMLETEECEAETLTQTSQTGQTEVSDNLTTSKSRILADREVMAQNESHMNSRKRKQRKWSLDVSAGNIPYSSSHANSGMMSLSPRVAYKYVEDANAMIRSLKGMGSYSQFKTDVKHKMPIMVGAGFRYNFTSHWGIESGLYYTLLSSDWVSVEGVNVYQKLHYIGIPLRVNYNILNSRFFTLYASAGGMMEKCLHAELGKRNGMYDESDSESLDSKPFQWSVSAVIGAQFNIIRQLGIFVEPGVTYYFDDHSEYQTIRKDYPFNFSLNMGLRVTFGK